MRHYLGRCLRLLAIATMFLWIIQCSDSSNKSTSPDGNTGTSIGSNSGPTEAGTKKNEAGLVIGADGGGSTSVSNCAPSSTLLSKVDKNRMLTELQYLEGLGERSSSSKQKTVADYLLGKLQTLSGLTAKQVAYNYSGYSSVNVEATIVGQQKPNEYVFVGAHFDSTSNVSGQAPGADDDGSGTVAVLEMARALAGCQPKRSIRFLFFSNEEKGTIGSYAYVAQIKKTIPPSQVVGLVSLDTLAYGPANEDLDIVTSNNSQHPATANVALIDSVINAIHTHLPTLTVNRQVGDACG